MHTYSPLPTSATPQSGFSQSPHFLHAGPYAPRTGTRKRKEKALVTWEGEGGRQPDRLPV